jgi:hypothetical protein
MADDLFMSRLLRGERILWSGKPGQGLLLTEADIYAIPFSLLWCGLVIFWTMGATRASGFGPLLVSAFFLCLGLYMLVGRFVVDAWIRRDLRYAVTNRRVLIARPAPFSKFTALNLEQLPEADLKERTNGRGTNSFRATSAGMGTLPNHRSGVRSKSAVPCDRRCASRVRPHSADGQGRQPITSFRSSYEDPRPVLTAGTAA